MASTNSVTSFTLSFISFSIATIIALIWSIEWYQIAILDQIEGYPFGGEGPVPYYYKNKYTYATNALIWAAIFTCAMICSAFALCTKKQRLQYFSSAITLALLVRMICNGMIGT